MDQGGADWSIIDLINSWPEKNDNFIIFVNKSHEGFDLLKNKIIYEDFISFNSFLENKLFKSLNLKSNKFFFLKIFKKIILFYLIACCLIEYTIKLNKFKFDVLLINNGGYPGALTAYLAIIIVKIFKRKKIFMIVRNYPHKKYLQILLNFYQVQYILFHQLCIYFL